MAKLKDVLVSVTQEDIDCGSENDPRRCAVARGIRRVVPDWDFEVNEADVIFVDRGTIPLPDEAMDFIEDYDRGREVEPFEFPLRLSKLGETN